MANGQGVRDGVRVDGAPRGHLPGLVEVGVIGVRDRVWLHLEEEVEETRMIVLGEETENLQPPVPDAIRHLAHDLLFQNATAILIEDP